ncbi:MAG TPA: hypothetical protein VLG39_00480 [Nitrospirota bacterium]|nr:hypothetical protein [Nitrospirota bacterium]
MTRLWLLIYLQNYYGGIISGRRSPAMKENGEKQTLKSLRYLNDDPVMTAIKEKLDVIFEGTDEEGENLAAILGQAVYRLEGLHPWPLNRRCVCGTAISPVFGCCGGRMDFDDHAILSARNRGFGCPTCGKTFTSAACRRCGRTYTWDLGIVESFEKGEDIELCFPGCMVLLILPAEAGCKTCKTLRPASLCTDEATKIDRINDDWVGQHPAESYHTGGTKTEDPPQGASCRMTEKGPACRSIS